MKNLFFKILFTFLPGLLFSQGIFKGTIKYELDYHLPPEMAAYAKESPTHYEFISNGEDAASKMIHPHGTSMENIFTNGKSYLIDRSDKKAYLIENEEEEEPAIKIIPLNETEDVIGYKCKKYLLNEEGSDAKQTIWVTTDLKVSDNVLINAGGGGQEGLSGVLKKLGGVFMKMTSEQDGNIFEMKAISVSKTIPEASTFSLSGYKIEKFDPVKMGKIMTKVNPKN